MKVFIVFCGLLIVNLSFLSYQGDMGRYVKCQNYLKAVAEESAAGAALYYDEPAYSEGEFRFRYEEGQKYIGYIIEESKTRMPLPKGTKITYEVEFQDKEMIPSVTVSITAVTEDLFHLPFLEVTKVKRTAKYELPQ
ncbi:MAG: hypothetical protein AAGU75_14045 [Bacillota bacterium]